MARSRIVNTERWTTADWLSALLDYPYDVELGGEDQLHHRRDLETVIEAIDRCEPAALIDAVRESASADGQRVLVGSVAADQGLDPDHLMQLVLYPNPSARTRFRVATLDALALATAKPTDEGWRFARYFPPLSVPTSTAH